MTEHDLTRERVARMIDHTLLKPEATRSDALTAVAQAAELGVYAVCLSPSMLPVSTGAQRLAVVAGFPSGKHHSLVKAAEARMAVDEGADEVDMVIDIGAAVDGRFDEVFADVVTVAQAVGDAALLKVIVESAVLLRLMSDAVGPGIGVKASGGIGDARFAAELIAAGATRLGTSRTAVVLDGF